MNSASLVKILVSLMIIAAYVFLFGIMGTVEGLEATPEPDNSVSDVSSASDDTTTDTAVPADTSPFTPITEIYSIDAANNAKPHLIDYNAFDTAYSEELTTKPTTTAAPREPDVIIEATTTKAPETAVVTTTAATAASPVVTTTLAPETTVEEATTAVTNYDEEAANEQLTVYYNGSGGDVTGDAVYIVARATMSEIGDQFDEEAIKAQAVAAYTYIKLHNGNGKSALIGAREPSQKVINIVRSVIGQAVYYNGSLIQAVYAAATAGYAASALNVWGVDYPYLRSHACELDATCDPYYGATMQMTSSEVASLIYDNSGIVLDGDPSNWFIINEYVDTVYVGKLTVGGKTSYVNSNGKTVTITGRVLREQLMNFKLKSASFNVTYDASSDKFTFTTYGNGHGVGLSQFGANALAQKWDYDYKQILQYYYPGTTIM